MRFFRLHIFLQTFLGSGASIMMLASPGGHHDPDICHDEEAVRGPRSLFEEKYAVGKNMFLHCFFPEKE